MNKNYLIKLAIWLTVFLALGIGIGRFIYTHDFNWQSPVIFQKPLSISKKVYSVITTIVQAQAPDPNINPLTPDQQYLCNKFGKDCVTALAIFRAESGMNAQAIHINTNGTVDFGCMQINSVHLKNIDTSKVNLLNCRDNIDVAYKIFSQQKNFSAWAAYTNGTYKKYLIN